MTNNYKRDDQDTGDKIKLQQTIQDIEDKIDPTCFYHIKSLLLYSFLNDKQELSQIFVVDMIVLNY